MSIFIPSGSSGKGLSDMSTSQLRALSLNGALNPAGSIDTRGGQSQISPLSRNILVTSLLALCFLIMSACDDGEGSDEGQGADNAGSQVEAGDRAGDAGGNLGGDAGGVRGPPCGR